MATRKRELKICVLTFQPNPDYNNRDLLGMCYFDPINSALCLPFRFSFYEQPNPPRLLFGLPHYCGYHSSSSSPNIFYDIFLVDVPSVCSIALETTEKEVR